MTNNVTGWPCPRDASHDVNETIFGWPQCFVCRAAPDYHERRKMMRPDFVLGIYVPVDGRSTAIIAPRSAVVGLPNGGDDEDDWTEVYYEGFLNGPYQYGDRDARGLWEAGVGIAADRMVTRYPTIATAHLPSPTLKFVGLFGVAENKIAVDNEDALNTWLEAS